MDYCTLNRATVPEIISTVEKMIQEFSGNKNPELSKQIKEGLQIARNILHRALVAAGANDRKRLKAINERHRQLDVLEVKFKQYN